MNVPLIISNHPDLESIANDFNSKFVYFDSVNSSKSDVEDQILKLIEQFDIDFVVLAKYM